jgi:tetratricopeptide (TPR) repeat protein
LALLFAAAAAGAHESASASSCQAAAAQPAIANAKAALDRDPAVLIAHFNLADAWSDAGCFNEAVQVLQSAQNQLPGNKELETRLRVAKSLVGEEIYFEKLDRAAAAAKFKRDSFRCSTLSDLEACGEAERIKPDDAPVLIANADALVRANRPAEAIGRYRRAAALVPGQAEVAAKISAAEAQARELQPGAAQPGAAPAGGNAGAAPVVQTRRKATADVRMARAGAGDTAVRRYSNADPVTRTH